MTNRPFRVNLYLDIMTALNENYTILIIDDESETRDMIKRFLAPEGYHLKEASCRKEVLELIENGPLDISNSR